MHSGSRLSKWSFMLRSSLLFKCWIHEVSMLRSCCLELWPASKYCASATAASANTRSNSRWKYCNPSRHYFTNCHFYYHNYDAYCSYHSKQLRSCSGSSWTYSKSCSRQCSTSSNKFISICRSIWSDYCGAKSCTPIPSTNNSYTLIAASSWTNYDLASLH